MSVGQNKTAILKKTGNVDLKPLRTETFVDIAMGSTGVEVYINTTHVSIHNYSLTCSYSFNKDVNGLKNISCAQRQCWGIDQSGSPVFMKPPSICPSHLYGQVPNLITEPKFTQIDTNIAGEVLAIERETSDVYYRVHGNSTDMKGSQWVNIPGIKLKSVAVGKDVIYGIDTEGRLVFMSKLSPSLFFVS